MKTLPLTQVKPAITETKLPSGKGPVVDTGFGDVLKQSLQSVNTMKQEANTMAEGAEANLVARRLAETTAVIELLSLCGEPVPWLSSESS